MRFNILYPQGAIVIDSKLHHKLPENNVHHTHKLPENNVHYRSILNARKNIFHVQVMCTLHRVSKPQTISCLR